MFRDFTYIDDITESIYRVIKKPPKMNKDFNFKNNKIQMSTLLSVKTGSCPEDCAYCPQSAHHNTNLEKEKLISIEKVKEAAINAKVAGSTRFCLGAAWRSPTDNDLNTVCEMIKEVSNLGLETCVTLGMLKDHQAKKLAKDLLAWADDSIEQEFDWTTIEVQEDVHNRKERIKKRKAVSYTHLTLPTNREV